MATTVTSKGQVTIPKHVRDAMKIKPGTKIAIELSGDDEAILRKVRPVEKGLIDSTAPSAPQRSNGIRTTDEYMEFIRGYEDDPGLK